MPSAPTSRATLCRRIATLAQVIRDAEAKVQRIRAAIESRKKTLHRLHAQLAIREPGCAQTHDGN